MLAPDGSLQTCSVTCCRLQELVLQDLSVGCPSGRSLTCSSPAVSLSRGRRSFQGRWGSYNLCGGRLPSSSPLFILFLSWQNDFLCLLDPPPSPHPCSMVCPWAIAFHWPNNDATQFIKPDKVQTSFSSVPSVVHCQSRLPHVPPWHWTPGRWCGVIVIHGSWCIAPSPSSGSSERGLRCSLPLHPPLKKELFLMTILGLLSRSPRSGLVGV